MLADAVNDNVGSFSTVLAVVRFLEDSVGAEAPLEAGRGGNGDDDDDDAAEAAMAIPFACVTFC